MSSEVLSARATWQNESGKLALKAEKLILLILDEHIKNFHPNLKFTTKPKIFNNIYKNFELTKEEIDEIFDGDYRTHGMIPEFLITNTETNISIIGEVKRQNGILSPLQELRLSELKKHGCFVYVWSDWNVEFKTKTI
jgi:hypothetical protein